MPERLTGTLPVAGALAVVNTHCLGTDIMAGTVAITNTVLEFSITATALDSVVTILSFSHFDIVPVGGDCVRTLGAGNALQPAAQTSIVEIRFTGTFIGTKALTARLANGPVTDIEANTISRATAIFDWLFSAAIDSSLAGLTNFCFHEESPETQCMVHGGTRRTDQETVPMM